jgi:hypothetical protein
MRRRPCYKSHMQEYLEKEFPAANTPIPCPVTMQVDRKNQASTVRYPHCRAQFNLPNQQNLLHSISL